MNLLCPNCQKMLTVPEQFAGQLMKCPLCSGTFTVPALPAGGDAGQTPPPIPLAPDPEPAFTAPASTVPAFASGPAEPAFATGPAKPEPKVDPKPTAPSPHQPASPSAASPPAGYSRTVHVVADVRFLQWVPLGATVLIFLLTFFPWVGVYPGGLAAATQTAWQAAFGSTPSIDEDLEEEFRLVTAEQAKAGVDGSRIEFKEITKEPGISMMTLFYLVPFLLVTLLITVFIAVQPRLTTVNLPPQVMQLLPFKWAILMGLNAVLLLFLTLQLVLSFGLEGTFATWVENYPDVKKTGEERKPLRQIKEARKGTYLMQMQRTIWFRLAYLLQLASTAAALLVYWVERRGTSKPPPALELRW